jgi:oxygen-independent coproporphyrinogen III oxidase
MHIPAELMQRYDQRGPRYTSYPTVPAWSRSFGAQDYEAALGDAADDGEPLSLYVHLPYCRTRCLYCGCNALASFRDTTINAYLDSLEAELAMVMERLGRRRTVVQMHWGGGTPNHLNDYQLARLFSSIENRVHFAPGAELSIECDPRLVSRTQLALLHGLGFTRISFGVQDLDPRVQEAIGRLQPGELVKDVVLASRAAGFENVNLDLVYGLPRQSARSFGNTLARVIGMAPDRIACFGYAHLPSAFPHQRAICEADLPDSATRFALFRLAVDTLGADGYRWIGLDHFARKSDPLAVAQASGNLHRDFMGYTVRPATHLVALGMSAISEVSGRYVQNDASLAGWRTMVGTGLLPVSRGHTCSPDDLARRRAILSLMCNLRLSLAEAGAIDGALEQLSPLEEDGLVEISEHCLQVTPVGRYFLRNICMTFDAYLPTQSGAFSRTV